jgi:hypothetical protein
MNTKTRLDKLERRAILPKPWVAVYLDYDRPGYTLANGDPITTEQFKALSESNTIFLVTHEDLKPDRD